MTGPELTAAMGELMLSQTRLACVLGVSRQAIFRWCRGDLPVPLYASAYVELLRENARVRLAMFSSAPPAFYITNAAGERWSNVDGWVGVDDPHWLTYNLAETLTFTLPIGDGVRWASTETISTEAETG